MAFAILGLMLLLLFLGYPMKVPLTAAAMLVIFVWFPGAAPETLVQQMIGGVQPAALIAVPMFILAAEIMTRGQAADRLLDVVMRFVGHIRGGLPITSAISCALFGALSGSTQATVVAIGGPLRPKMIKAGYPDSFAMALIINASDIALLIPPSIGMIVYGVVSGTSIGENSDGAPPLKKSDTLTSPTPAPAHTLLSAPSCRPTRTDRSRRSSSYGS